MNKLKIATNTLAPFNNCGGILQAYALQTVLDELGHDAYVVARDRRLEGRTVLSFADKYLKWDKRKIIDIKPDEYDCIITGSDQIFRREWSDANYIYGATSFALDWPIKKVGYAISMGVPTWNYTEAETELIRKSYNTYSGISFRENDCTYMVKNRGVDNAVTMPDPTLLLKRAQYEELIKDIPVREHKCFVYLLGTLGNHRDLLQTHAGQQLLSGLKTKFGTDNITINKNSVEEWLAAFRDAEFVITDSYHGCLFSLIFNKPFICIMNETRGNSRFTTLIEEYGLHTRFCTSLSSVDLNLLATPLETQEHVLDMYEKGRNFLKESLSEKEKQNAYVTMLSTDDYLKYVVTLYDSLKKTNPKYDLYVALTPNISNTTRYLLDSFNIKHVNIDSSDLNEFIRTKKQNMSKWERALPKFALWKLIQFDKCVYLDSDLVITGNIDNLFDYPEWSAVEDGAPIRAHGNYQLGESVFCSGVLIFKPSIETYNKIIDTVYKLPQNIAWHDQAIMAYMNQDWINRADLHIPYEYDFLYMVSTTTAVKQGLVDLSKVKIHHYCLKNWTQEQIQPEPRPYYAIYKKLVEDTFNIYTSTINKLKKCIGIISYLPDNEDIRNNRKQKILESMQRITDVFPGIDILIIAQNWKDFKITSNTNNIIIHSYDKLGIVGARKQLRKDFLKLDYDYIIMIDDDLYINCTNYSRDDYLERIDKNPNKFCFLKGPGLSGLYRSGAMNMCAISKYVYSLEDLADIDPQKGEGYEDIIYAWLLHCKYPELEFEAPADIYAKYKSVISTWSADQTQVSRLQMLQNTKKILNYIEKYKKYPVLVPYDESYLTNKVNTGNITSLETIKAEDARIKAELAGFKNANQPVPAPNLKVSFRKNNSKDSLPARSSFKKINKI